MYAVSERFKTLLKGSHTRISRAQVIRGSRVAVTLEVTDGFVTVDYDATTRRSLDCTVVDPDPARTLAQMRSVLDPFRGVVRVWSGVRYPDQTEELVPCGTFYIDAVDEDESAGAATFLLTGYDASDILARPLTQQVYIAKGTLIHEAIPKLLRSKLRTLNFAITPTQHTTPVLLLRPEDNAWAQAVKLAQAAGQDLFVDRLDTCTSLFTPADVSSVWDFTEGETADFWQPSRRTNGSGAPNVVMVIGSHSSLTTSVSAIAADMDPRSPTYRYGEYGERTFVIRSERVRNVAQAQAMAQGELARTLGGADDVSFAAVPNPALDVADGIRVTRAALGLDQSLMFVNRITLPLVATEGMGISARRWVYPIGAEQS